MQTVFLAFAVLIACGTALLWWGFRGRKLNDHPLCRDCGFDLSGVFGTTPPGVTCPECGAGLKRPKATRIGQRRRRPIAIAAGLLIMLTALLSAAGLATAAIRGIDWDVHKPSAILLWELRRSSDAARSRFIAAELMNRMIAKSLSSETTNQLIESVLEVQGDPQRPWDEAIGDLIEHVARNGLLSVDQEQRFCRQAVQWELLVRPVCSVGEPLATSINVKQNRFGSTSAFETFYMIENARIGGRPMQRCDWTLPSKYGSDQEPIELWSATRPPRLQGSKMRFMAPNAKNRHALRFYKLEDNDISESTLIEADLKLFISRVGSEREIPETIKLQAFTKTQAASHHTVRTLPTNYATSWQIRESLVSVERSEKSSAPIGTPVQPTASRVTLEFAIESLPVQIAYQVEIACGPNRWFVGHLLSGVSDPKTALKGNDRTYFDSHCRLNHAVESFDCDSVDVILTPRPDLAAATLDLTEIYGERIVIEKVRVQAERSSDIMPTTKVW